MKINGYSLNHALGALAIGAAVLLGPSEMTYAQGRYQPRQHQRWERNYYGESRALRNHQWRERQGYYNNRYYNDLYNRGYYNYGPYSRGYYNYRPYNRGYYDNGWGFSFGWGRRRW